MPKPFSAGLSVEIVLQDAHRQTFGASGLSNQQDGDLVHDLGRHTQQLAQLALQSWPA